VTQGSYGQFCPVAMAAEVLCTRWTPLVLRELMAGSTRFNDLRRGVPTCHVVFGEATAILAGDALLTHGLGVFAAYPAGERFAEAKVRVLATVVEAIGTQGMIGESAEVVADFTGRGRVRYGGELWNARSDAALHAGDLARIVRVEGLTLWVEPR